MIGFGTVLLSCDLFVVVDLLLGFRDCRFFFVFH